MLPVKRLQCNDPAEHVPDGWWFMFIFLLLHPVVEVLVPGGGELVLDDITHAHKILQPLLEDRVHAHVVWASSVSVSLRRTKTTQTYRKSGYAGSSSSQTDGGSSNRRTRHQGYQALATSRVARPSRLQRNSLLHDDISQRIPQRMVLAIKLETSRRLSRARELSYLLVSYLSRHCRAKPRPQTTGDEPKPRTTKKQKNKKQIERGLGTTYNANSITVNSRVNLLAVLRRRVDNGLARARFRSGRHLFFCVCFVWPGRWKVRSFSPSLFFPLPLSLSLGLGSGGW
jgi:hypothetical protein